MPQKNSIQLPKSESKNYGSPFDAILAKYRTKSFSESDKGTRFERLMQAYLMTDRMYSDQFKKVWMWNDFPFKEELGGGDTGIDIVAQTHDGEFWAIQCKCYQENATIDKPAIDTFLSTSSRQFRNEKKELVSFKQRFWIDTVGKWGDNANNAIQNQHPPFNRLTLGELRAAPVDWEKIENDIHGEAARTPRKKDSPASTGSYR